MLEDELPKFYASISTLESRCGTDASVEAGRADGNTELRKAAVAMTVKKFSNEVDALKVIVTDTRKILDPIVGIIQWLATKQDQDRLRARETAEVDLLKKTYKLIEAKTEGNCM